MDPSYQASAISDNPPAMVSPFDHAWFIAGDTDPHWSGIGPTSRTIAELSRCDDLDVVEASPVSPQPFHRP